MLLGRLLESELDGKVGDCSDGALCMHIVGMRLLTVALQERDIGGDAFRAHDHREHGTNKCYD